MKSFLKLSALKAFILANFAISIAGGVKFAQAAVVIGSVTGASSYSNIAKCSNTSGYSGSGYTGFFISSDTSVTFTALISVSRGEKNISWAVYSNYYSAPLKSESLPDCNSDYGCSYPISFKWAGSGGSLSIKAIGYGGASGYLKETAQNSIAIYSSYPTNLVCGGKVIPRGSVGDFARGDRCDPTTRPYNVAPNGSPLTGSQFSCWWDFNSNNNCGALTVRDSSVTPSRVQSYIYKRSGYNGLYGCY